MLALANYAACNFTLTPTGRVLLQVNAVSNPPVAAAFSAAVSSNNFTTSVSISSFFLRNNRSRYFSICHHIDETISYINILANQILIPSHFEFT